MAMEMVGGAFLSSFLSVLFDRLASREVLSFFKRRKLDAGLLEKLKITMYSVCGVLDDAEEKQIAKPYVQIWLNDLKDAVYKADDLLDEIAYESLKSELEGGSRVDTENEVSNWFSSFYPFKKGIETEVDDEIPRRLENILERLEYLLKQKDALGLEGVIGEKPSSTKTPTTSLVEDEFGGVYGRDADMEAIVQLMLSDDTNANHLDVIPIVGLGGVGKTTLARLVYNDKRVEEWFNLKAWVCVSEDFNVLRVTKEILEEVTRETCDSTNLNQLQLKLKENLMGKIFLLVLDDVWNDKQADWDSLRGPLRFGDKGSKIVVTTRNQSVASMVHTLPTHHLKELTADDCWSLFEKHAFVDEISRANPELQVIGREIAKKCKGLPLAAKSVACFLRFERDVEDWEKILRSSTWDLPNDNVLPALRLSYHYLPSHLKQCFAYCAIFPKDYEFKKEDLILLWMAEGFLVQPEGREDVEIGGNYFDDLLSRSFFQQSSGNRSVFVMHDLINDLANSVSGEFCFRVGVDDSYKISKRTRYLSLVLTNDDISRKFEIVHETQHLRTLLSVESSKPAETESEVTFDSLLKLTCLRVLSLSFYRGITYLPDLFGNLKHLRYLDLRETSIERLPESITSFYNLQTLILHKCQNLVELPANVERLINLGHLDLRYTNLSEMPPHMGKLTKLQILTDFTIGKQSECGIKELGKLQHLRGELAVWNLQNVVNVQDALDLQLKGRKHIKELRLGWNGNANDSVHERLVFENLQPHENLESLYIIGYGGTRFPDWVGDGSFSNIVSLKLYGCIYCSSLPPLGQLPSLKILWISGFDGIVKVGSEFYGSGTSMMKPFRSLEVLRFHRMPQWQEWISHVDVDEDEDPAFPHLQELYIKDCPNLINALPNCLPSLGELEIIECPQFKASLPKLPSLRSLKLMDDWRYVSLDLESAGYRLRVGGYHTFDSFVKAATEITDAPFPHKIKNVDVIHFEHVEDW